mmetsp:Transcript_30847/g.62980  ORF Transcript_30847/g.62980 Transcript_30847/m.62980 type:complete len:83 (-) Transcript_30847:8-256(-)
MSCSVPPNDDISQDPTNWYHRCRDDLNEMCRKDENLIQTGMLFEVARRSQQITSPVECKRKPRNLAGSVASHLSYVISLAAN